MQTFTTKPEASAIKKFTNSVLCVNLQIAGCLENYTRESGKINLFSLGNEKWDGSKTNYNYTSG